MGIKAHFGRIRHSIQLAICCQVPRRYWRTVRFPHPVGIVIGDAVRIGKDVRIYQNVTIGLTENVVGPLPSAYPTIDDEVFIYAGAVIFGSISIGARSIVGANAIVSRDVPPDSVVFGYNQVKPRQGRRPLG